MKEYVAFLRGINVGGKNIIKMDELTKLFSSWKFENVKTYLQSGNIVFTSKISGTEKLSSLIEKKLKLFTQNDIAVMVRSIDHIKKMIEKNPFKKYNANDDVKKYVIFLKSVPGIKLPLISEKEQIEIVDVSCADLFCLGFPFKNRYGFPNIFVEKEFGIPATTRNWNTITKIIS